MPKKKFTFKKRDKNVEKKEMVKKETVIVDTKYVDDGTHLMIKDKMMETIVLKKEDYEGKENIILENL